MHDMYAPTPPTSPYGPYPEPKSRRKRLVLFVVLCIVVIGAGVGGLLYYRSQQNEMPGAADGEASLTLYYRDGKTVLWRSNGSNGLDDSAALPPFAAFVDQELMNKFGGQYRNQGAWRVTTTLDEKLQETAEAQILAQEANLGKLGAENAALVAQDVTNGQVVSWVGGHGNGTASADMITKQIEPGILTLPFVYAALLENTKNVGAGTLLDDTQGPLTGYACTNMDRTSGNCLQNFDYTYVGQLTLRQALGTSRLVPAVKAAERTTVQKVIDTISQLNGQRSFQCYADVALTQEVACYTAAMIGDGVYMTPQLTLQAYATLANDGVLQTQTGVLNASLDGKTKYEWKQSRGQQAVRADTAYIISDILADPNASYIPQKDLYTIAGAKISIKSGIEPGATSAGAIQYSTKYAVGLWMTAGAQPLYGATESVTLSITSGWLQSALAVASGPERSKPGGIKELPTGTITLHLSTGTVGPSPATDLFPSWYE